MTRQPTPLPEQSELLTLQIPEPGKPDSGQVPRRMSGRPTDTDGAAGTPELLALSFE